jgi:hypothetical protein
MYYTIDLYDTIEVDDPISFCKNKEENVLELIKAKFVDRNFNGHHIIDIIRIKRLSRCSIIPSNLSVKGRIHVHFTVLINSIDQYVANMKVHVTEPRVTCASEDKKIIAGLIQNDAHKIIQRGQYIPIKVDQSSYDPFKKSITVSGSLLHCDTTFTVYKTNGALTKEHAKDLMYKVNELKKELDLRNQAVSESIMFFELLFYSFRTNKKDIVEVKSKEYPWKGPPQIRNVANTVNLLEKIKEASEADSGIDITGYWCRPLELYRSSPLVVYATSPPKDDAGIVEQPPHVVIAELLQSMIIIKTIRELSEHFDTKEKFVSHKNIWKVIQNYQKSTF